MHAAGGLVASPEDIASWMMWNLRGSALGLGAEVFSRAQARRALAVQPDGPFLWRGYALGQQIGEIEGVPVLGHRGGYEGARSISVASLEIGVGFSVMVNSDFGSGT